MTHHNFVRVGAAVSALRVADPVHNVERVVALLARAEAERSG